MVEAIMISIRKPQSTANEFFKGIVFCIAREGLKLYATTIERLGPYISTQFKKGSDLKKCLIYQKLRSNLIS